MRLLETTIRQARQERGFKQSSDFDGFVPLKDVMEGFHMERHPVGRTVLSNALQELVHDCKVVSHDGFETISFGDEERRKALLS